MPVRNRLLQLMADKQKFENRLVNVPLVAAESGISSQTLYNWLDDEKPPKAYSTKALEQICRYFRCKIGDFLEIVEDTEGINN